jgi:signal peptidase I
MQETMPADTTTRPASDDVGRRQKTRRRQAMLVGGLLVFALLLRLNLRQGRVWGNSMEPTFYHDTTVLVWKTVPRASLRAGDVIIFRDDKGDELIKRIAFIRQWQPQPPTGSYVHPNGGRLIPYSLLFDNYFKNVRSGRKPRPASENTIYVLGDNLVDSDDSRSFGPISSRQVLGKVVP